MRTGRSILSKLASNPTFGEVYVQLILFSNRFILVEEFDSLFLKHLMRNICLTWEGEYLYFEESAEPSTVIENKAKVWRKRPNSTLVKSK